MNAHDLRRAFVIQGMRWWNNHSGKDIAAAIRDSDEEAGWVLVPRACSQKMADTLERVLTLDNTAQECWRAMIAASEEGEG